MTISPLDVYLVSLADKIIDPASFIAIFALFFMAFLCLLFFAFDTCEEIKRAKCMIKLSGSIAVACGLLAIFIPSSRTLAAMYVLPAIVNNEHIQNSTGNALKALEELTKEWLNDTIKSKEDAKPTEAKI